MKMEMETKKRWPEHDIYLYGKIAFLPSDIENKAMTWWQMRHYFPYKTISQFESSFRGYERDGFLKLNKLQDQLYVITNIEAETFRGALLLYLDSIELDSSTLEILWEVAAHKCKPGDNYRVTIKWQDIYDYRPKYSYIEPFWEIIFTLAKRGWIKLKRADYTKAAPVFEEDGITKQVDELLLRQLERPVVEFEIVNKAIQQRIKKRRGAIKYKVGIILTKTGKLQLFIDGKRHTIVNYKSQKNNTYRVAQALYDANEEPLTKSGLNLKTDTKTDLRTLVKNTRITGILEKLFIVYEFNRPRTVCLKRHATIDLYQHEQLVEYVKTLETSD